MRSISRSDAGSPEGSGQAYLEDDSFDCVWPRDLHVDAGEGADEDTRYRRRGYLVVPQAHGEDPQGGEEEE